MTLTHRRLPVIAPRQAGRRRLLAHGLPAAVALGVAPWLTGGARAQATAAAGGWPTRPIRIVQPGAPGGGGDIVSRLLAQKMHAELGQPVVVDNRAGAGGNIGAQHVSRQPADGYTLIQPAGAFAIQPSLLKDPGYDALKDFAPITKIAVAPLLVLVRADSPLRTLADLIALAKREPTAVSYGSFGIGSPSHLIGEVINRQAGIAMTHVPSNSAQAAAGLLGGHITIAILDALSQAPQVKAGKVRALALNGTQRLPGLPDVPTLTEGGIPFDLVGWHAMFAPAGTPRDIVERLNRVINQILAQPDVKARLFEMAMFPLQQPTTPEQWGAMFRSDVQAWGDLVRSAGITPG
jgi:tripartite-type tricarboxylate transporter receptor subunit TctC